MGIWGKVSVPGGGNPPSGAAGGSLSGTYPNPHIADNAQALADLEAVLNGTYVPMPSGTAVVGDVPVVSGTGPLALNWGTLSTAAFTVVPPVGNISTGGDEVTLNAALAVARLAGGGTVKGVAGQTYYIASPVVPGSNTILDMTGCFVVLVSGSNCNMLQNYAVTPVASTTDGAISAGSATLTTAATASVGQSVTVAGAGNGGQSPLTGIVSALGSGTVTLQKLGTGATNPALLICLSTPLSTAGAITSLPVSILTASVTASTSIVLTYGNQTQTFTVTGAGAAIGATSIPITSATPNFAYPMNTQIAATCSISSAAVKVFTRDANIKVIGGIWNRGANAGSGTALHSLFFRHVDGLVVDLESYQSTAGKYGISYADITNFSIRVRSANCSSSALQGMGPLYGGRIEGLAGATGDDSCPFTCSDYTAYADGSGDIQNVTIGTVQCQSANANGLKFIAGAGLWIDDIRVDGGIFGAVHLNAAWIGDDTGQVGTTGGAYGVIDCGFIAASYGATSFGALILNNPNADHIKAAIRFKSTVAVLGGCVVAGAKTSVIRHLELAGDFDSSLTGVNSHFIYMNSATTTINKITCDKVVYTPSAANPGAILNFNAAGTVVQLDLLACGYVAPSTLGNAVRLATAGCTLTRTNIIGGYALNVNAFYLHNTTTTATVVVTGGFEQSGGGRFATVQAAATVNFDFGVCQFNSIYASGTVYANGSSQINLSGGDGMIYSGSFVMLQRAASESVTAQPGCRLPLDLAMLTRTVGSEAIDSSNRITKGIIPATCTTTSTGGWVTVAGGTY